MTRASRTLWRTVALAAPLLLCGVCQAQVLQPAQPASAATARLRADGDQMTGSFAKAIVGTLLVVGAGIGLASAARKRGFGVAAGARQTRLRPIAHLRLGPKCTLHLVEADGHAVLVASGEEARLMPLPSRPASVENVS